MYRHQALEHTHRVSRGGIIRANRISRNGLSFWRVHKYLNKNFSFAKIRLEASCFFSRTSSRVYHFNDWWRGNQFRTQSAKERRKASMLHGNRESFLQLAWGLRTVDDKHTLPLPRIIPSSEKKRARTRVILVLYIYIELPSNPSSAFLAFPSNDFELAFTLRPSFWNRG